MSLEGKKVLITGASGGLGLTISRTFCAAGATVFALDHDAERNRQLAAACSGERGALHLVPADLGDLPELRRTVGDLLDAHDGVDVLINNAAIYPSKPFESYSDSEFAHVHRVNFQSAVVLAQLAVPYMKARRFGRIVNVASITFGGGWPDLLPYVTSKGALIGMTRALARELGAYGITVNCVSPGAFPTAAEQIHGDAAAYARFVLDHQSIKRRGDPADIAGTMLFLASEECSFMTGQTLNVDGGWMMH